MAPMSEEQQRVVDAYFDGVNADRFAEVAALFAPDAQLIAPGVRPRRGPEEIAPYFAKALSGYPVHHDDPTRIVHAIGTTTVEIEGKHVGIGGFASARILVTSA